MINIHKTHIKLCTNSGKRYDDWQRENNPSMLLYGERRARCGRARVNTLRNVDGLPISIANNVTCLSIVWVSVDQARSPDADWNQPRRLPGTPGRLRMPTTETIRPHCASLAQIIPQPCEEVNPAGLRTTTTRDAKINVYLVDAKCVDACV